MWILVGVPVVVLAAAAAVFVRLRRRRERPLVSIVLLRKSRRNLTESEARSIARRTLHSEAELIPVPFPDEHGTTGFCVVLGMPRFYLIDAGRPYMDDPDEAADNFEDPRAREAMRSHTHWVAVDLAGKRRREKPDEASVRAMALIAAELIDDDTTLVYAPWLNRVALPGPETEAALRGDDPLSIFSADEPNTPIVTTGPADKRVQRAIARAKREWPKFVEVWSRRGRACSGIVKGGFPHGDGCEYMWIEVEQLADGEVRGTLMNSPAHVNGLKKGQRVTVAVADVVDWACEENGEPMGMFVEKLLWEGKVGR